MIHYCETKNNLTLTLAKEYQNVKIKAINSSIFSFFIFDSKHLEIFHLLQKPKIDFEFPRDSDAELDCEGKQNQQTRSVMSNVPNIQPQNNEGRIKNF